MDTRHRTALILAPALAILLAAGCGRAPDADRTSSAGDTAADAGDARPGSFIGRKVAGAIAKAGERLKHENIRIDRGVEVKAVDMDIGRRADPALPRAELTPDGTLLVDGRAVEATPAQQVLLQAHRRHLEDLALAGLAVGARGADVAGTALTGLGEVVFGGEEGRRNYEARVEAEARRIRSEVTTICALLPDLLDSQQALAAAMPAFAPYARLTRDDIDDCFKEAEAGDDDGATAAPPA